jgi:hypothetical protein
MHSVPPESRPADRLPPLSPVTSISRPLSTPEYYHACVGTSPKTLEPPRYQGYFIHADSSVTAEQWQAALDQASAANPGTHLRLVGRRGRARWESDGVRAPLRLVENLDWDMRSDRGAEFVHATPLSLEHGPTLELVVARLIDGSTLLLLRSHHAVIDGIGMMHFLEEIFRALRGEPLLGSNAHFSDVDLMLSVGAKHSTSRHIKTQWLTGAPAGEERGDEWRRISLGAPGKNLLARLAAAMTEFAHRSSELPVLIGVPVNLRRHVPGMISTANFSNMLMVPMQRGDGAEQFNERLRAMLAQQMEAVYPRILDLFKQLPFEWCDRLFSRTEKNYRTKKALETAVISNLGRWDAAVFSCSGFTPRRMFIHPLAGSVFAVLVCVGNDVELTVNLPRVLASNGRFDALAEFLKSHLAS